MREKPEKKREGGAEEQAGNDGKVEGSVFATMDDVAWKSSKAKGELVSEIEKDADQNEKRSEENERASEIAKGLHKVILPDAAGKSSENGRCYSPNPCVACSMFISVRTVLPGSVAARFPGMTRDSVPFWRIH